MRNYLNFISKRYRLDLVKTFVDRLYKINNAWSGFHNDMNKTKSILQENLFPIELVEKVVINYLSGQKNIKESLNKKKGTLFQTTICRLFFTRNTHNKIKGIIKKLCKDQVNVNLVFIPYKNGSIFSIKDKIPSFLNSMIVCKFICASCNACYVGEIAHHLPTRIKEHLKTDKKSHIYQHLSSNQNCFNCGTDDSILDYALTKNQLEIKEALFIKWFDRFLNKQKKTLKITLSV